MRANHILTAFEKALMDFEQDPEWMACLAMAQIKNPWFTNENSVAVLNQWRLSLSEKEVQAFLNKYQLPKESHGKKLGLVMAGNIPAVGMHDVLMGLIAGYKVKGKLSSLDETIPKLWVSKAAKFEPEISKNIEWVERLNGVDFVIVTGSDNTARTFEYYFKDTPKVLRKNRNSLAVITGNETKTELAALGKDIFDCFGLGCRSVTHIKVPKDYNFKDMIESWTAHVDVINHNKYANNYTYHKSLLLLDLDPHIDSGFGILHESEKLYSPVSVVHYSFYNSLEEVTAFIEAEKENIQCIVGSRYLPLGTAQCTMLSDYADSIDTLKALTTNCN